MEVPVEEQQEVVRRDVLAGLVDDADAVGVAVGRHAEVVAAVAVLDHLDERREPLKVRGGGDTAEERVVGRVDELGAHAHVGEDRAERELRRAVHGVDDDAQARATDCVDVDDLLDRVDVRLREGAVDDDAEVVDALAGRLVRDGLAELADVAELVALADDRAPAARAEDDVRVGVLARHEEAAQDDVGGSVELVAGVDALDLVRVGDLVGDDLGSVVDEASDGDRETVLPRAGKHVDLGEDRRGGGRVGTDVDLEGVVGRRGEVTALDDAGGGEHCAHVGEGQLDDGRVTERTREERTGLVVGTRGEDEG